MKLLIIGFTKLKYMPYANLYLDKVDKSRISTDFIYWDRDDSEDLDFQENINYFKFNQKMEDSLPLLKKIRYFIKFRMFAKKHIKNNNYDKIIVLHSTPGILLFDELVLKNTTYILDYRDVTYENKYIYKLMISKLVDKSFKTFISSEGFLNYLPKSDKILNSHNIDYNVKKSNIGIDKPIKIGYWGLIRHKKVNEQIIKALGNDDRFELHYYGRSQKTGNDLKEYVKSHKYENIFFHGEYLPNEKIDFINDTHIIHNMFDNDITMQPATSNKYYDALLLRIPQLCTSGSFMGNLVSEKKVGLAIDTNADTTDISNTIYNYYNYLDKKMLEENCNLELNRIKNEMVLAERTIKEFLNKNIFSFIAGKLK